METNVLGLYRVYNLGLRVLLGLILGYPLIWGVPIIRTLVFWSYRDNGKQNGNYYIGVI